MAETLYDRGMEVRRAVLGDEHVDAALERTTDFDRPMQELAVEYCWGGIWTRPGLDRRSRSIINLAMLGALGRQHELEMHVRGALANGLTEDEIGEVLLQVAVYCGIPAGIDAFRTARRVIDSEA